jgi:hypothetical protein
MSSNGGCNIERNEKEKNHSDKIRNKLASFIVVTDLFRACIAISRPLFQVLIPNSWKIIPMQ